MEHFHSLIQKTAYACGCEVYFFPLKYRIHSFTILYTPAKGKHQTIKVQITIHIRFPKNVKPIALQQEA